MPESGRLCCPHRPFADRLAATLVWGSAVLVLAIFLWIVGDLLWHGARQISLDFLLQSPRNAGRSGGIASVLVNTLLILAVCLAAAVPLSLACAIWLAECTRRPTRTGRLVRNCLDILAGIPSIVFGLFGNALFCVVLGFGFSILSGGLTLACMVLPLLIRSTEEGIRAVPEGYRQASAALAMSSTATLRYIILPAALPGMIAGLVLGIGRALAETAALLFTSGYVDRMPESLMDSGRALSIHVYDLAMNVPGGEPNAYGSALLLIATLMVINLLAVSIARRFRHQEGP